MSTSEESALAQPDDAPLERMFAQQLLAHPGKSGVGLVPDGGDAFALRAMSARAAKRSIDAQYYIWHGDTTGRFLACELLFAADRGVHVRVLLDDMDARSRDSVLMALNKHPGIEIRIFNPFAVRSGALRMIVDIFLRGSRLNHRMHNKSWIVDGRMAMVGGRNIGDEYFSASSDVNFVDLDVVLAGTAVDQAARAFDRYWNDEASAPIEQLYRTGKGKLTLDELRATLMTQSKAMAGSPYARRLRESPRLESLMAGKAQLQWCEDVRVVADDPRKVMGDSQSLEPGVLESLIDAIGQAQSELLLISPYFVPGAGGTAALRDLVRRGAEVAILTNSLAATDVAAVHSGYARYRTSLLEGGVKLHELKPTVVEEVRHPRLRLGSSRASLHTKAAVIDQQRIFVGSFNMDPRSADLNCEMGVWVASDVLAAQMRQIFAAGTTPQRSFTVTLNDREQPQWAEVSAGKVIHYDKDPQASWGRRAVTWLLQFLPIESQL